MPDLEILSGGPNRRATTHFGTGRPKAPVHVSSLVKAQERLDHTQYVLYMFQSGVCRSSSQDGEGEGDPGFEKQPPRHLPEKSKRYRKSAYQLLL
jgi:hypothetical protein